MTVFTERAALLMTSKLTFMSKAGAVPGMHPQYDNVGCGKLT